MKRSRAYLVIDGDSLDRAERYNSVRDAVRRFAAVAEELENYGQEGTQGAIHLAPTRAETVDYPDYVLSIGPRGGVRVERA